MENLPKNDVVPIIPMSLDYRALAQEILVNIRGEISQRELSDRLGFSFNQVGKWEAGVTRIKWEEFLRVAIVLQLPIEQIFKKFFWNFEGDINAKNTLLAIESFVSSNTLEQTNFGTLKKRLSATQNPDFNIVLQLLDARPNILVAWLSNFIECKKLSLLGLKYENFLVQMETVFDNPLSCYVNAALQLQVYQSLACHDESLLAEHSACSVADLRLTLSQMMDRQLIRFKDNKYIPLFSRFSFGNLNISKLRSLTKYSTSLAAQRYPTVPIRIDLVKTPNSGYGSVAVAPLSASASKKISALFTKLHNDITEIVNSDSLPKDNVQTILAHSFASNINPPNN